MHYNNYNDFVDLSIDIDKSISHVRQLHPIMISTCNNIWIEFSQWKSLCNFSNFPFCHVDRDVDNENATDISQFALRSLLYTIVEMARVHRVALILTIVATSYLLTLFGVLSVPLVDPKVSEKILPVVHSNLLSSITTLFWRYFPESRPTLSTTCRFSYHSQIAIFACLLPPFRWISFLGGY
jgi:hypothetical protein